MVMPSLPMSVKSERPSLPGGCSCRKMNIPLGTGDGTPGANAPFQGPTHAWADLGMTTAHLLEDGYGSDARRRRQHRHDLAVPYTSQWIGTAPAARRLLLRRQPRIGFNPIAVAVLNPAFAA